MRYARVAGQLVLCQQTDDLRRSSACLCNGFRNILRALADTGEEYTGSRRLNRTQLCVCLSKEVVGIHAGCQHSCQRTSALVCFDCSSQNDHVSLDVQLFVGNQIRCLNIQCAVSLRCNLADHTLNIVYAILLYCTAIELIIVLARGTNVDVEYINVSIRIFFTAQHSVLCGIHTADLGAVFLTAAMLRTGFTAADALYEYQCLRLLAVGQTLQVTIGRTVCLEDSLEFQRSHNILALGICKFIIAVDVDRIITSSRNDCAVLFFHEGFLLLIVDRTGRTYLGTQTALALGELDAACGVQNSYVRDRLCKRDVSSVTVAQSQVISIRNILYRTLFGTSAASGTFIFIDKTSLAADLNAEVAHESGHSLYFTVGIDSDLVILCAFYHLRSQNTGRAVQCRECLIDLCHLTADGGFFFYDIDRIASLCDIQSGLDTCDTAADNQSTLGYRAFAGDQRCIQQNLCNGCTSEDDCLCCSLLDVLMDP